MIPTQTKLQTIHIFSKPHSPYNSCLSKLTTFELLLTAFTQFGGFISSKAYQARTVKTAINIMAAFIWPCAVMCTERTLVNIQLAHRSAPVIVTDTDTVYMVTGLLRVYSVSTFAVTGWSTVLAIRVISTCWSNDMFYTIFYKTKLENDWSMLSIYSVTQTVYVVFLFGASQSFTK